MSVRFPWKRFWCPTDGKITLEETGFLSDPESEYAEYCDFDVVSFDKINKIPCLILLGEPGIGKTYSIYDEINSLKITSEGKENSILLVELKKYGSEDRLERDICNSKQWKDFKKANHNLYLFLDGLDEVRFRIDNVSSLLLSILEKAPIERLFLRISCRTAEWPSSFEVNLKDLWKNNQENNVKAFEIAPLRECDVHEAAKMCRKKPLF